MNAERERKRDGLEAPRLFLLLIMAARISALFLLLIGSMWVVEPQWTNRSFSVMTGSQSIYPFRQAGTGMFPKSLRPSSVGAGIGYTFPESQHPNLRFWFTPDVLEELNLDDGSDVKEWRNVASICYHGHPARECTPEKKNRMFPIADEVLMTPPGSRNPTYIKFGRHGALRFTRSRSSGAGGQLLQMYTTAGSNQPGFSKNPFNGNFTIFMVVRTRQQAQDVGNHGILELKAPGATGLVLHQPSVECIEAKGGGELGSPCQKKAACPRCAPGAHALFGTYNIGFGNRYDDNSCRSVCSSTTVTNATTGATRVELKTVNTGCSIATPKPECKAAQGSQGVVHLAEEWKVLSLRGQGGELCGYISGRHASEPPLYVRNATVGTIETLRYCRLATYR